MTAMLPPVLAYGITCLALGVGLGVPLGRLSQLLLWRASWRAQYLREAARSPAAFRVVADIGRAALPEVSRGRAASLAPEHAGQYAVPRSVSNGVEALADRQFRVR